MRFSALLLASFAAVAGCGSEDNVVLAGYSAVISPVHSSISTQATFTDASGAHPQWVIAMSDVPDLCAKVTAHQDYFQNPIESFTAILVWVPPGKIGTFFVGQSDPSSPGSTTSNEVLVGFGPDTGTPHVLRLAASYLRSSQVVTVLQPVLDRIASAAQEISSLSVLDGEDVVFIARGSPARVFSAGLDIGYRLPAFCTSVGRVMLGQFDDAELAQRLAKMKREPMTPQTVTDPKLLCATIIADRAQGYGARSVLISNHDDELRGIEQVLDGVPPGDYVSLTVRDSSVREASFSSGTQRRPLLSCSAGMTEIRLAFPQRSPHPLMVP